MRLKQPKMEANVATFFIKAFSLTGAENFVNNQLVFFHKNSSHLPRSKVEYEFLSDDLIRNEGVSWRNDIDLPFCAPPNSQNTFETAKLVIRFVYSTRREVEKIIFVLGKSSIGIFISSEKKSNWNLQTSERRTFQMQNCGMKKRWR